MISICVYVLHTRSMVLLEFWVDKRTICHMPLRFCTKLNLKVRLFDGLVCVWLIITSNLWPYKIQAPTITHFLKIYMWIIVVQVLWLSLFVLVVMLPLQTCNLNYVLNPNCLLSTIKMTIYKWKFLLFWITHARYKLISDKSFELNFNILIQHGKQQCSLLILMSVSKKLS